MLQIYADNTIDCTWEIYKRGDEWRWRKTDQYGQIVQESRIGFRGNEDCVMDALRNGMK